MSKISLKHSGGNVVSLNSPTNAPGAADVAFKLPNQDGSANEFLKTDGSGNLSFGAAGGGKFASYAIIADQKSDGTNGGTFTTGAYRTRDLNTEVADADGIVSISNNQFTLQAGSYFIHARMPYIAVGFAKMKLYNVTDSSDTAMSDSGYSSTGVSANLYLDLKTRVTIASAKAFEIQMAGQVTRADYGFGYSSSFGTEVYTTVVILKES